MSKPFPRILVPLDGTKEAEVALAAVMPLVRIAGSRLTLLRVIHKENDAAQACSYLETAVAGLRNCGLESTIGVRFGAPADQILSFARDQGVDLIAIVTHGREGPRRAFLGSVTESVLRHAGVPLLVCRPQTAPAPWDKIVVALDGSDRAEQILPLAVPLARSSQATLDLLRVCDSYVIDVLGDIPLCADFPEPSPYLGGVREDLARKGVVARSFVRYGDPATEILRHATTSRAGLICMTTRGRTGLSRLLLGSVAEAVLRHAPCPVLVRHDSGVPAEKLEARYV